MVRARVKCWSFRCSTTRATRAANRATPRVAPTDAPTTLALFLGQAGVFDEEVGEELGLVVEDEEEGLVEGWTMRSPRASEKELSQQSVPAPEERSELQHHLPSGHGPTA